MAAIWVASGFGVQVVLLAFFAAHRWRPAWEGPLGKLVYGLGIPAVMLAVVGAVGGEPWYVVAAFGLYAAWSALGSWIDLVRPIQWRVPPRLPVLVPYVLLLTGSLLAFWIPLWWVDRRLWFAFGVLYAGHTTLNIASHRGAARAA